MQLSPRYEGPPVVDIDEVTEDPCPAFVRQRDRLGSELAGLTEADWKVPSRCEGWSVQDVIEHLAAVNRYWLLSVASGLRGEPTRLLESFDPVTVPAAMVDAARGAPPSDTLERFVASNRALADLLGPLTAADRSKRAEAPPGHLAVRAVVAHGLWDSWVHERDVLEPLSRPQVVEADEVSVSLAYVAALGPAIGAVATPARSAEARPAGVLGIVAHAPELRFTVDVAEVVTVRAGTGDRARATIEGDTVDLIDSLSFRSPPVPLASDHRWLLGRLGEAFGQPAR